MRHIRPKLSGRDAHPPQLTPFRPTGTASPTLASLTLSTTHPKKDAGAAIWVRQKDLGNTVSGPKGPGLRAGQALDRAAGHVFRRQGPVIAGVT